MELTTDFECGAGRLTRLGDEHWRLETVGESFGYDKFFCLSIKTEATEPKRILHLEIVSDQGLGGKSHFMTHFPSHLWYSRRGWTRWCPLRHLWEDAVKFLDQGIDVRFPIEPGQTILLATNVPLRYSELMKWSEETETLNEGRLCVGSIGKSFEGRDIPVLRMGDAGKPKLLVLAAQHSSEYGGAWACQGIVEYLLTSIAEARQLATVFDLAVIPMLNPDGNVHGLSASNTQGLVINNSLDFLDAADGKRPQTHENIQLWDWIASEFQPDCLIHFHGYMGWRNLADHPYDGVWTVPELSGLLRNPQKLARQRAIMQHILFQTPGFSGHWRHAGVLIPEMLDYQMAKKYGTIGVMYEINTGVVGPYEQFRRGPQVFSAVARAWLSDLPRAWID